MFRRAHPVCATDGFICSRADELPDDRRGPGLSARRWLKDSWPRVTLSRSWTTARRVGAGFMVFMERRRSWRPTSRTPTSVISLRRGRMCTWRRGRMWASPCVRPAGGHGECVRHGEPAAALWCRRCAAVCSGRHRRCALWRFGAAADAGDLPGAAAFPLSHLYHPSKNFCHIKQLRDFKLNPSLPLTAGIGKNLL